MISMSPRLFRKTKSYTAISLAWDRLRNWGKTQRRGKKKSASQAKRYSPGREMGPSSPRDFYAVSLRFSPLFFPLRSLVLGYDPLGNNSSASKQAWAEFTQGCPPGDLLVLPGGGGYSTTFRHKWAAEGLKPWQKISLNIYPVFRTTR